MPTKETLRESVLALIRPLTQNPGLDEHSELVRDLGLSSLEVMELIEAIEDHFDISIPLNILPRIRSIEDLVEQLEQVTADEPV